MLVEAECQPGDDGKDSGDEFEDPQIVVVFLSEIGVVLQLVGEVRQVVEENPGQEFEEGGDVADLS